jgi:hypothetical protein
MAKKIDPKAGASASKKPAKPAQAKPATAAAKPKAAGKASTPAAPAAKAKPAAKKAPAAAANGKKPAAKAAPKAVRVPTAAATPAPANAAESEPTGAFFYFLAETIDPQVTRSQPSGKASDGVTRFAEFAAVRQHAIDYLVDLIDRCEVRLWQIKRADSLDALEELVREHEHPPLPAAGEETPCAPS